ncbi:hypothetical protein O5265_04875 [Escherichia coli]|nr:hypothetical protein [Escherichia coli]
MLWHTPCPEERFRIKELLGLFPSSRETKVDKLIGALGVLWQQNPEERIVIFATYLGTVEMLGEQIEKKRIQAKVWLCLKVVITEVSSRQNGASNRPMVLA